MTNHVHWIVVPEREDSLATLFGRVHGRQRSGHLWQNRFFSCPLAENRLWVAWRYVERNPVRTLLAASPEDYPWSSARPPFNRRRRETGGLGPAILGGGRRSGGLATAPRRRGRGAVQWLRRCTYAGRPFGSEEFVKEMEAKFGRAWRYPKLAAA
ncbi:MAG: transposase [Bryobacteraceae bacterium]